MILTNTLERPVFVGSRLLTPGASMECEESDVPEVLRHAVIAPDDPEPAPAGTDGQLSLAELLQLSIAKIEPQLEAYSVEQMDALRQMEQASAAPRVTLLAKLDELILQKAVEANTNGDQS